MKHKKQHKRKKVGFTIIEVMIVLAIAGLIMVIVFIAVPSLQAARRDTQRRSIAGQVFQALEEYYKNNRRFPGCTSGCNGTEIAAMNRFISVYMPDTTDPTTGNSYRSTSLVGIPNGRATASHSAAFYEWGVPHDVIPEVGQIYVAFGHVCYSSRPDDGSGGPVLSDTGFDNGHVSDVFAVVAYQERGQFTCLDNYGS